MNYFDTNVIIDFWKQYQIPTKKGSSENQRKYTIFSDVVMSEYSVDELINIPIEKKRELVSNLKFILRFSNIPVILSSPNIEKRINKKDIVVDYKNYFVNKAMVNEYAGQRLKEVLSGISTNEIPAALKKKKLIKDNWYLSHQFNPLTRTMRYSNPSDKKSLNEIVSEILIKNNFQKPMSFKDYFKFCMELYISKRDRRIIAPSHNFYKTSKKSFLNEQIDFYHLTYAYFADNFVTNDSALLFVAKELQAQALFKANVHNKKEYFKNQK